MNLYLVFAPVIGLLAIVFAIYLMRDLLRKKEGTLKMIEISDAIKTGAHAYLVRQFFVAGLFFSVSFSHLTLPTIYSVWVLVL